MKTDDLISLLANRAPAIDRNAARKRLGIALVAGAAGAVLLVASVFGVRTDLLAAASTSAFWMRLAFPALLAGGALWAVARLSRPGMNAARAAPAVAAPVLLLWAIALLVMGQAEPGARAALVMGTTWRSCPWNIALLSAPAAVAVFWAIRGLAPLRLRLAGAAGGLLAGAVATLAYCLHCPETSPPFWAVWYVAGMLIPTTVGALLGPRWLRW